MIERELAAPLAPVDGRRGGRVYGRAVCLARLHGVPIGLVPLNLRTGDLSAQDLADHVTRTLGDRVARHLADDGLESSQCPTPAGLRANRVPACERDLKKFLAKAPPVSVVVPTRERPEILDRCLQHLAWLDYPDYEVLVVDNAPVSPATRELVRRRGEQFGELHYLREDRPGQSWARNRGLMATSSSIVAFVDDDVAVDRGWLSALASAFASAEDVGCVTGLILPAELDTDAQALLEEYGGFSKGFDRRVFDLDENRPPDPLFPYAAGRFGSGASMAFRADVLRQVGAFNLALGTGSPPCGGEDLTAFRKVVLAGHKLVYEPAAIAYHPHPRTYRDLRRQLFRYGRALGAYMTACLIDDPGLTPTLASKAPAACRHLVNSRSARNRNRGDSYPPTLVLAELLGVALGPLTYAHGRVAAAANAKGTTPR
jgi:GT2 family glycosyltransferase